jgi:aminoglycoside N3'-acetyltransferase
MKRNVYRSHHPIFSFAAWGNNAEEYLHLYDYDCFGAKSIFGKIYDMNAKYILFGLEIQNGLSAVYFSEQRANVYYRYFKEFEAVIDDGQRKYNKKIKYFVRDKKLNYKDSWYNLQKKAIEQRIAIMTQYNGGKIFIIKSQGIDDLIIEQLKKNKDFLIMK